MMMEDTYTYKPFDDDKDKVHWTKIKRIRTWANIKYPTFDERNDPEHKKPKPSAIIKCFRLIKCKLCEGPGGYILNMTNQNNVKLKRKELVEHFSGTRKSHGRWQWEGHKKEFEWISYVVYIYHVFCIYLVCIWYEFTMYLLCINHVLPIYLPNSYFINIYVFTMYLPCIYLVFSMYLVCISYVFIYI